MVKPIFGEALAFYTGQYAGADYSLVVYHPLIEHHLLYGRWYGKWSSSVHVKDNVHVLRRHPGLAMYI